MSNLLATLSGLLAQVPVGDLDRNAPRLNDGDYSTGITWMIIAAAVLGILAIAFKTSKRTHMDS